MKNLFFFLLFLFTVCFDSAQSDSAAVIKVKPACPCNITCFDTSGGPGIISIDLNFEKNLSATDFNCYGFYLKRADGCRIACVRNADSSIFIFTNLPLGVYYVEFFGDGYHWTNNALVLRRNDCTKTSYFSVGMGQLPLYQRSEIKKRRKKA